MIPLLIRFWPYIAMAALAGAAALFFGLWQGARQDVGVWKERHRQAAVQTLAFDVQLKAANKRIRETAASGAVSYGQCQDLGRTNATQAFDKGVIFGRNTCPAR